MAVGLRDRLKVENIKAEQDPAGNASAPIRGAFKYGSMLVKATLAFAVVNFVADTVTEGGKYAAENISINPAKAAGNVIKLAVVIVDEGAEALGVGVSKNNNSLEIHRVSDTNENNTSDGVIEIGPVTVNPTDSGVIRGSAFNDPECATSTPVTAQFGDTAYGLIAKINPTLDQQQIESVINNEYMGVNPTVFNPSNLEVNDNIAIPVCTVE